MRKYLSLASFVAACGTAPADEQPSGCQIDSDCKTGRVCLEGMCQAPLEDATIADTQVVDAQPESVYYGTLLAIVRKNGVAREEVFVQYDLKTGTLEQLTDAQGILVAPPSPQEIFSLTRPAVSPDEKKIAFVTHVETKKYGCIT